MENYFIKPCQKELYKDLDAVQMKYAMAYGYEKDDLTYCDFICRTQKSHIDPISNETVTACCREHARDLTGAFAIYYK
jgi:hypothetical protein